ncbi:MAG: hypothetical protein AB9M60_14970 [Leptothrix sp. (in: b-proteobacteria)]
MTTVHFIYPRDASRHSSPWCIGNELGERLERDYRVQQYNWRDRVTIRPEPGDVLLGHPHWSQRAVYARSVRQPGFARRIILAPYVGDLRQVALHDRVIDQSDLFMAITGRYWFDRIESSAMARWRPKMRHVDLAVNRSHFPTLERCFNPPGQRRFAYIGHTARNKNTPYLTQIAATGAHADISWIGRGRKAIAGLTPLGFQNFSTAAGREVLGGFDFTITVGDHDCNPTTILESLSWGLIPICTAQSGYLDTPGIVNVPLGDAEAASRVLAHLQQCPESELMQLRDDGERMLREQFHWDRVYAQIRAAIDGSDSPRLAQRSLSERLQMWAYNLVH